MAGPLMNLRSVKLVPAGPVPPRGTFRNAPEQVKQGKDGSVQLSVTKVEVHGPGVIFEPRYGNLGCWYGPEGFGRWTFDVRQGGTFDVQLDWACQDGTAGNHFKVVLDDKTVVEGEVLGTGTWDNYRQQKFGQVRLDPGPHRLEFRAADAIKNALIDLRTVISTTGQTGRDEVSIVHSRHVAAALARARSGSGTMVWRTSTKRPSAVLTLP